MTIVVKEIRWTRTILEIDYLADARETLCLYRTKTGQFKEFDTTCEAGVKKARLNLVMGSGREPLDAGEWILTTRIPESQLGDEASLFGSRPHLVFRASKEIEKEREKNSKSGKVFFGEKISSDAYSRILANPHDTHAVGYESSVVEGVEGLSRVFRYGGGRYAYTAAFIPRYSLEDRLVLILAVDFFEKNRSPRVRKRSLRFFEGRLFSAMYRMVRTLAVRKGNRVLFFKENGDKPTENLLALKDRMLERGLGEEFEVTERYRDVFQGRQSLVGWLGDVVAVAKSDYIFIDDHAPIFNHVALDEKTVLTQVWHAGVGFKSVGYARFGLAGSPDPYQSGHRGYTFALIGNRHLRSIYSEVFGIEEEALLATGMPRLDGFLDEDAIRAKRLRLLERYPWAECGRVVLFAPTFRGTGQKNAYYPYQLLDLGALFDMCEKTDSYFVFEMHHFIKEGPDIPEEYGSRLFDLSDESLNDLFHISDILVTDYSSCFYDYVLLKKPVVFYAPDKATYCAVRGVQRPYDEFAPGVVCETFEEFVDVLEKRDYLAVEPDPAMIDRCIEGGMLASDRAIDSILLGMEVPGVK